MRRTILARPNLKLFLVAAVLIALLHDFISNGRSQSSVFRTTNPRIVAFVTEAELEALLREVETRPSAGAYARISEAYEKRGDVRKAMRYLRLADFHAQFEDGE